MKRWIVPEKMGGGTAAQGVFSDGIAGAGAVQTLPQDPKQPSCLCRCGVATS